MYLSLPSNSEKHGKLFYYLAALAFALLVTVGIFASNGWFPSTDLLSGKRTGWFGRPLAKNAPSSWNPIAPDPTPTPVALSKEYLYAGSRLLAVEDANANAAPPADLAIWRPSTSGSTWWVLNGSADGSYSGYYAIGWGTQDDRPVAGDYDGDGKTDFAIYRPSTNVWWINRSSDNSYFTVPIGSSGDKTVQADYDGDGKTDVALFRPSTHYWYIVQSSTGNTVQGSFGTDGDVPAPADFDGDGKADLGVWRESNQTFYSQNSTNGALSYQTLSHSASETVPADYDGDGRADYAIRKYGSSDWVIYMSGASSISTISWQNAGDRAVQNDYDADGKCDIAVWRDSTGYWYIRPSTSPTTTRSVQWGMSGDTPVPAYYRR